MCSQFMYSCGESLTNGQNRVFDLLRLIYHGCNECAVWAEEEMRADKKRDLATWQWVLGGPLNDRRLKK